MINFKDTLKELENSKEFKEFKKQNKNAFLAAGFFVIDNETSTETRQLDFATGEGESKELMTFIISKDSIQSKPAETIKKEKFSPLAEPKIELDKAIEIMKKETKDQAKFFTKVIAILQIAETEEKAEIWNLTCLAGFNMFRLQIDAMSGKIFKEENHNLMDIMKIEKGNKNKDIKIQKAKEGANYVG